MCVSLVVAPCVRKFFFMEPSIDEPPGRMGLTSASWLNAVEGFFAKLTNRRLKRGVFRSVADLEDAINRFVAETNADPKPFVWTARPNRIRRCQKREGKVRVDPLGGSRTSAADCLCPRHTTAI